MFSSRIRTTKNVLACKYKLAYSVVLINNFFSANVPIYMGLRFGPKYNASDFVFSMLFHIFVHMYFGPQWLYYRKEKKTSILYQLCICRRRPVLRNISRTNFITVGLETLVLFALHSMVAPSMSL